MGLSQICENITDGKDYRRGCIEKDENMQINGETIQDEEITYLGHLIRHNSSQIQLIEANIEGRRSCGRSRNTWTTDVTTTNGTQYYQLKRAAEDKKYGMDS